MEQDVPEVAVYDDHTRTTSLIQAYTQSVVQNTDVRVNQVAIDAVNAQLP